MAATKKSKARGGLNMSQKPNQDHVAKSEAALSERDRREEPYRFRPLPADQCTLRLRERSDLFPDHSYAVDVPLCDMKLYIHRLSEHGEKYAPVLDPDYQRAHVWTREQQIAFIEYILRGGEVSRRIIFATDGDIAITKWRLIDGKQRLEAITQFLDLKFGVFPDEQHPEGHFANAIYEMRGMFMLFKVVVVRVTTRLEELNLYLSLNTAGTPHSSEEIDRVRALRDAEIERMKAQ